MSHLWEKEKGEEKEKKKKTHTHTKNPKQRWEGGKKGIEKERKEGRRNKERSEAREEGILTKIKTE